MRWVAWEFVQALLRLRGYEPQPVTPRTLWRWWRQFPPHLRSPALQLLNQVHVVTKSQTVEALVGLNEDILQRLYADGVGIRQVVYVSLDSAGSSSSVMLNLLRNHAKLEKRGAQFVHSAGIVVVRRATQRAGRGALVYVDDFSGSGDQFIENRGHLAQYLPSTFAEFVLAVCVCEEAKVRMDRVGVVSVAKILHD